MILHRTEMQAFQCTACLMGCEIPRETAEDAEKLVAAREEFEARHKDCEEKKRQRTLQRSLRPEGGNL